MLNRKKQRNSPSNRLSPIAASTAASQHGSHTSQTALDEKTQAKHVIDLTHTDNNPNPSTPSSLSQTSKKRKSHPGRASDVIAPPSTSSQQSFNTHQTQPPAPPVCHQPPGIASRSASADHLAASTYDATSQQHIIALLTSLLYPQNDFPVSCVPARELLSQPAPLGLLQHPLNSQPSCAYSQARDMSSSRSLPPSTQMGSVQHSLSHYPLSYSPSPPTPLLLPIEEKPQETHSSKLKLATSLFTQAKEGNLKGVTSLLQQNAPINHGQPIRDTPLYAAITTGRTNIVKVLLAAKAVLTPGRYDSTTLLHVAAEHGHTEIVAMLLKAKADVNDQHDFNQQTPLHKAAEGGYADVVILLLKANAVTTHKSYKGQTPLHQAAEKGHTRVVEILLEAKANANQQCRNGQTPLHQAAENGYKKIVEILLEAKADVTQQSGIQEIALHLAAKKGHKKIVTLLLGEENKGIHTRNKAGFLPLHFAASEGHEIIVKRLIKKNANIHREEGKNTTPTPLFVAARKGRYRIVKLLLEEKAKLGEEEKNIKIPLHAAIAGYKENPADAETYENIIKLLLDNKEDVNASGSLCLPASLYPKHPDYPNADQSDEPTSPIMRAARAGLENVVSLLLEKKAKVDKEDEFPLCHTLATMDYEVKDPRVVEKYVRISELLIKAKADPNAPKSNLLAIGCWYFTPLQYAAKNGQTKLVLTLLEAKADIDGQKEMSSPLQYAVRNGYVETVKCLLEKKANIHKRGRGPIQGEFFIDTCYKSPLFIAAENNDARMVGLLLNADEPQVARHARSGSFFSSDNKTALICAIEKGHVAIVKLLVNAGASPNVRTEASAVYAAAKAGQNEVIKVLVNEYNALINAKPREEQPLYVAAEQGHTHTVKLLLTLNANPHLNEEYRTLHALYAPETIAALKGYHEIATIISEAKKTYPLPPHHKTDSLSPMTSCSSSEVTSQSSLATINLLLSAGSSSASSASGSSSKSLGDSSLAAIAPPLSTEPSSALSTTTSSVANAIRNSPQTTTTSIAIQPKKPESRRP